MLNLPSAIFVFRHLHVASSSSERREPRLDRGGLRLGERVVVEVQHLQRHQRSHRVGKCRELVAVDPQRLKMKFLVLKSIFELQVKPALVS